MANLQHRSKEKSRNGSHEDAHSPPIFVPGMQVAVFMLGIDIVEEFKLHI